MEIIENSALLVNTRYPGRITNAIKKSIDLGEIGDGMHQVLIKWGLQAAQKLRALKYKGVPSPMRRDYKFPGMFAPFSHQRETAEFLSLHKKAFCFSEAGTGKSAAAIWAADYLMTKGIIKRVLIICPVSVMQSAWQADLFKTVMHRTVDIAYGQAEKRKKIIKGGAEFVIINFDGIEIVEKEILAGGFDLIICDEMNAYKTTTTRRFKVLKKIIDIKDPWLWGMTGTPACQSPEDAYGLAKLVNPNGVPKFFGTFRDMVMYKVSQFRWVPRPKAEDVVHSVLQPAIRFTKDECLDLPAVVYQNREVEITAQQKKFYELLRKQMTMSTGGEEITAVNAAVLMNKLLQISAGSVYSEGHSVVEFDATNRLKVLTEIIEETAHKVVVFANFTHSIDQIVTHLTKQGITCEVIDGRVHGNKRNAIITQFQTQADPRVLILQPQAAAHGITLTAANVVVWFSPVTSLENWVQGNARIHRAGQRNKMTVVMLQGTPVERKIYSMLRDRLDVHTKLIDLYKEEI